MLLGGLELRCRERLRRGGQRRDLRRRRNLARREARLLDGLRVVLERVGDRLEVGADRRRRLTRERLVDGRDLGEARRSLGRWPRPVACRELLAETPASWRSSSPRRTCAPCVFDRCSNRCYRFARCCRSKWWSRSLWWSSCRGGRRGARGCRVRRRLLAAAARGHDHDHEQERERARLESHIRSFPLSTGCLHGRQRPLTDRRLIDAFASTSARCPAHSSGITPQQAGSPRPRRSRRVSPASRPRAACAAGAMRASRAFGSGRRRDSSRRHAAARLS